MCRQECRLANNSTALVLVCRQHLYSHTTISAVPPSLLQHKKHGSEVDEQQLAAAKAFLEQHLASTAGGAAAAGGTALAAAAGGGGSKSGGSSSSKSREKPAGELPADVDPLTVDDYFERAAEFTAWLQETRHQYFNGRVCWRGLGAGQTQKDLRLCAICTRLDQPHTCHISPVLLQLCATNLPTDAEHSYSSCPFK